MGYGVWDMGVAKVLLPSRRGQDGVDCNIRGHAYDFHNYTKPSRNSLIQSEKIRYCGKKTRGIFKSKPLMQAGV